ncbi:hypothetical protein K9N50_05740 [bacterium]|nr:hypothetical protein [bacterium]
MSLLAGYISKSNLMDEELLTNKVESYSILEDDSLSDYENNIIRFKHGHIILKRKHHYPFRIKPILDDNGNILIIFGLIVDFEEDEIDKDNLIHKCIRTSAENLEKFEGEFIAVFYEEQSGIFHIVNDRYSSRRLYILEDRETIYFSTDPIFLQHFTNINLGFDKLGVLQLFCTGHSFDVTSTFEGVKKLTPATHLTVINGKIKQNVYWQSIHEPNNDLDPVEYSEKVFNALKMSSAKRVKLAGKGVIALSGGWDSRFLTASMPPDSDVECLTWQFSDSARNLAETDSAMKVAKALGKKHRIEHVSGNSIYNNINNQIRLLGGQSDLNLSNNYMIAINLLKNNNLKLLIDGSVGSSFADKPNFNSKYLSVSYGNMVFKDWLINRTITLNNNSLKHVIRKDILRDYYSKVLETVTDAAKTLKDPTPELKAGNWTLRFECYNWVISTPIRNHPDMEEVFPFLGYDYYDLMLKLPENWYYKRQFYEFMVYHHLTDLRDIVHANLLKTPRSKMDMMLGRNPLGALAHAKLKIRKTIGYDRYKRLRFLYKKRTERGWSKEWYDLFRGNEEWGNSIKECLNNYSSLGQILDIEKCMRFINDFYKGQIKTGHYIEDMLMFSRLATICYSCKNIL